MNITIVLLNNLSRPHNFQPIRLLDKDCCYIFAYLMAKSADPDQLASSEILHKPTDLDLHSLQNRVYPGSAGQGLMLNIA